MCDFSFNASLFSYIYDYYCISYCYLSKRKPGELAGSPSGARLNWLEALRGLALAGSPLGARLSWLEALRGLALAGSPLGARLGWKPFGARLNYPGPGFCSVTNAT